MIKKLSLFWFVICIFLVSGCSMLNFDGIKSSDGDPEVESEKIVALLHDNIISSSVGEFDEYFISDDDTEQMYRDLTETYEINNEFNRRISEISGYLSEETTKKWFETFKGKIFAKSDYVIDNIKVDDGEVEVDVTVTIPDFSKAQDVSKEKINEMLTECFWFDVNDADLFFTELALRKGVEENELRSIYSSSDSSVWIKDILELFSDEFESLFNLIISDMLEDCPQKSYRIEYTVKKQIDDTYRITDVENN